MSGDEQAARRAPGAMGRRARGRLGWIPNALTASRLAGIPAVSAVAGRAHGRTSPSAGLLFGAIAATDYVDGALARRLGAETRFGKIADPAADRLLNLAGVAALLQLGRLHPAGPALLIGREFLSVAGFLFAARRGVVLRVDTAGKGSSALTMIATGLALLTDDPLADAIFWAAVLASLGTFAHYAVRARALIAEAERADESDSASSTARGDRALGYP